MTLTTRRSLLLASLTIAGVACLWLCAASKSEPEYVDHHPPTAGVMLGAERSSHWPTVKRHYLAGHPACEACGTTKDLNVHHVQPFHEHPELELDPSNLITLCRQHHFQIGHQCSDGDHNWATCSNPRVREDAAKMRGAKR